MVLTLFRLGAAATTEELSFCSAGYAHHRLQASEAVAFGWS
jgi:hypothetical protein